MNSLIVNCKINSIYIKSLNRLYFANNQVALHNIVLNKSVNTHILNFIQLIFDIMDQRMHNFKQDLYLFIIKYCTALSEIDFNKFNEFIYNHYKYDYFTMVERLKDNKSVQRKMLKFAELHFTDNKSSDIIIKLTAKLDPKKVC